MAMYTFLNYQSQIDMYTHTSIQTNLFEHILLVQALIHILTLPAGPTFSTLDFIRKHLSELSCVCGVFEVVRAAAALIMDTVWYRGATVGKMGKFTY